MFGCTDETGRFRMHLPTEAGAQVPAATFTVRPIRSWSQGGRGSPEQRAGAWGLPTTTVLAPTHPGGRDLVLLILSASARSPVPGANIVNVQ